MNYIEQPRCNTEAWEKLTRELMQRIAELSEKNVELTAENYEMCKRLNRMMVSRELGDIPSMLSNMAH